jgi:Ca2+/Na+ antiporter
MIFFFQATELILTIVSVLAQYTHLSHIFIGITVISWGSCLIELINLSVANKNAEGQMGITSILSAIVLQFLLIVPLAVIIKMYKRDTSSLAIFQPHHSIMAMFLPSIMVSVIVGLAFWYDKMALKRKGILVVSAAYGAFVI